MPGSALSLVPIEAFGSSSAPLTQVLVDQLARHEQVHDLAGTLEDSVDARVADIRSMASGASPRPSSWSRSRTRVTTNLHGFVEHLHPRTEPHSLAVAASGECRSRRAPASSLAK